MEHCGLQAKVWCQERFQARILKFKTSVCSFNLRSKTSYSFILSLHFPFLKSFTECNWNKIHQIYLRYTTWYMLAHVHIHKNTASIKMKNISITPKSSSCYFVAFPSHSSTTVARQPLIYFPSFEYLYYVECYINGIINMFPFYMFSFIHHNYCDIHSHCSMCHQFIVFYC